MKPFLLLILSFLTFYSCTWKHENNKTLTSNIFPKTEMEHYKSLTKNFPFTQYITDNKCSKIKEKLNISQFKHLPTEIVKNIENQYNNIEKPNFGNKYIIISWSCGSPCQMHAFVDFNSGNPTFFMNSSIGINFKAESYLLIKNPPTNEIYDEDFRNIIGKPTFYIFKNDSLIELYNN